MQEQTGYLITEQAWQELYAAHGGNVPFYSDGDGSTTFRVPSLKCWVRGANGTVSEVGSYLEAGLPNITGGISFRPIKYENVLSYSGAFSNTKGQGRDNAAAETSNMKQDNVSFDASRSSAIYGKSSTVQPQSIVGLWLVKAYGTVIETGSIDEKQYIDSRLSNYLPLTGGTIDGEVLLKSPTGKTVGFQLTSNDPTSQIYKTNLDIGWNWANREGAGFYMCSVDNVGTEGCFGAYARTATQSCDLTGYPDGRLTWGGHNVITDATAGTVVTKSIGLISVTANTPINIGSISLSAGTWIITGNIRYTSIIAGRQFVGINTSVYITTDLESTVCHYSDTTKNSPLTISTSRIFTLTAQTTIYLVGYGDTSCSTENSHLTAVRIK